LCTFSHEKNREICQTYYGSIGFSLPCALGAHLASRELHESSASQYPERRTILVIGDGSAQLTIQEIGTMINNDSKILM